MNNKGERVHEIFKGNYFQPLRPDIKLLKQKYQSNDSWLIISSSGRGELYPNVAEIFRKLKNNHFPIFIASNRQTEYLDAAS